LKRALSILAAAIGLLLVGWTAPAAQADRPEKVHKSYVCKYVGKPGVDERLQTGHNPIWVDNHALLGHDGEAFVGQEFSDAQGRSIVIVANTPKLDPEPGVDQCPQPEAPPSAPPSPPPSPAPSEGQPEPPTAIPPAHSEPPAAHGARTLPNTGSPWGLIVLAVGGIAFIAAGSALLRRSRS